MGLNYTNLPPLEKSKLAHRQVMKSSASTSTLTSTSSSTVSSQHTVITKSTGAIKKIPENLKLRSDDKINNNNHTTEESSVYRVSGPYIPLSDCFSGSPVLFVSSNIVLI